MWLSLLKVEKDHNNKMKPFTGCGLGMVVQPHHWDSPNHRPLPWSPAFPLPFSHVGGWREALEAQKEKITGWDMKNLLETANR